MQSWHGALTVHDGVATVAAESWNANVPAGGTITYGFTGRGDAPALPPVVDCSAR